MLLLFNIPPVSLSVISTISIVGAAHTHTHISRNLCHAGIGELVFAQRDVNSNSNGRSCRMERQRYCPAGAQNRLIRIKKNYAITSGGWDSWIIRLLLFRFDSRLFLINRTALRDAKWCRHEGQHVLDQTASSESKDVDYLQHFVLKNAMAPRWLLRRCPIARFVLSPCLMKEIAGPVSLSAAVKIAAISLSSFFAFENWSFLSDPGRCQQRQISRAILNWKKKKSTNKKNKRECRDERGRIEFPRLLHE